MINSESISEIFQSSQEGTRVVIGHVYNRMCEWTGFHRIPDLQQPEMKGRRSLMLDVPGFVQMDGYSCGYLAGLAVLRAFKPNANAKRFYNRVKPCLVNGTSTKRLVSALRKSGIVVGVRYRMSYSTLVKSVRAGFPTIISTGHHVPDHWAVVVGVSDKHVFVQGHGNWLCSKGRFTRRQFERIWCPKGFALICSAR